MDFKIRQMKITDYEQVYKLWKGATGVNLGLSDTKHYIKQYLKKNKGLSYVALNSKNKIIGTVLAGLDRRRAYIYHVTVDKKYQGKGIGHDLMKKCEAS